MAKVIKEKESENGAQPPRILALDDYFMQEVEKKEVKRAGQSGQTTDMALLGHSKKSIEKKTVFVHSALRFSIMHTSH